VRNELEDEKRHQNGAHLAQPDHGKPAAQVGIEGS
jgi:hypothetical protein